MQFKDLSPWNNLPCDFSVTAWFLQALKTARLAQLKFDSAVFSQGLAYLDNVTDQGASRDSTGAVGYQVSRTAGGGANGHPALTAAGRMIRQFNGTGVKNHLLIKGAELTQRDPPRWSNKDFYYWYYATYAMHNMGGEHRIWWNQRIRDVLLENQNHEGDHAGSWDPDRDRWGKAGGRVYTTALGGSVSRSITATRKPSTASAPRRIWMSCSSSRKAWRPISVNLKIRCLEASSSGVAFSWVSRASLRLSVARPA